MQARCKQGFTIIELVVVIGIIAYLVSLLMPMLSAARRVAQRTQCASNMRQLGYAVTMYANDNRGWVPRDCTIGRPDRQPWMIQLMKYLKPGPGEIGIADLPQVPVLQCPSHPLSGIIPTGYVINAFAFETQPSWAPDGPEKITSVARKPELPWLLESAIDYIGTSPSGEAQIYLVQYHDVYSPDHLPNGELHRISDDRHYKYTANVLYLDGHVATIRRGDLKLEMFDDGLQKRATTPPPTRGE